MNRNLFVFSLLLVLVGVGVGFYFISFIGLLLMIPSLVSSARAPPKPTPGASQPQQMPWRISPPHIPQQQTAHPANESKAEAAMTPAYQMASPAASQSPMSSSVASYSAAIFPSPIIPTLSQVGAPTIPAKDAELHKQGERDELVELGTILVLLKLILG